MLQRAASNACSWWWASHIRTKQSKWLEQCMQDMEEKVQCMIKLIAEEGDSFAKRAEMYYKRRPELINSVEETYRAFKSLADRYDLLSKELQNANNTIATVFPEQVQFDMEDDDDFPSSTPKFPKKNKNLPENKVNIPKVPKAPMESLKGFINTASKQFQPKKSSSKSKAHNKIVAKSGLSKDEAILEIDKVHKEILGLQTVKEFVKSSYESGLAKYWEIENQITEMQEKVCKLQDEYDIEIVIEDNEARTLMAEAALKSCQETLTVLQEKQEKSTREAKEEFKKIEAAREILKTLKRDYMKEQMDDEKPIEDDEIANDKDEDVSVLIKELKDINPLQKKAEKCLDTSSTAILTVTELAEEIDELVNKVITLETAVSSQTVLINTLRTEADDLHSQVMNLEAEKETLIGSTQNMRIRVKKMEDKLNRIQDLDKNVEEQNSNLETNLAEARSSLDHLLEKLSSVKPDEDVEQTDPSQNKLRSSFGNKMIQEEVKEEKNGSSKGESKSKKKKKDKDSKKKKKKDKKEEQSTGESKSEEIEEQKDVPCIDENKLSLKVEEEEVKEEVKEVDLHVHPISEPSVPKQDEVDKRVERLVTFSDKKAEKDVAVPLDDRSNDEPVKAQAEGETEKEGKLSWQQMLLSEADDREKVLLKEYTTILKNYKDVKRRLSDTEKKERDTQFDITVQIRELKQAIVKRDHEIQHLRQQLSNLQGNKDKAEESGAPRNNSSEDQRSVQLAEVLQVNEDVNVSDEEKEEDNFKSIYEDKSPPVSVVEEQLRMELDAILDENLDFWLRFSTSFHQVQKFKSGVEDLQDEISKLKEKKKQEGITPSQIKSEVRPIYKHLREIQTELTVWLEQSVCLKEELKRRFTSLCSIQEEITTALKEGVEEEEIRFSSHQAAKLQGEILNMKQENNKVREELHACFDHVSILQLDAEKTLRKLNIEFAIASDQPQLQHSMSRARVPLRAFIFGQKEKKHKNSLFSFMQPNRKYHVVRPIPRR